MGDDMGRRYLRDFPSWWVACQPESTDYDTSCQDRSAQDQRGVGVGRDDGGRALFLADTLTSRLARASDGSIWVIGGSTIEDLRSGRSDEPGAIYRIDPIVSTLDWDNCEDC